MALSKPHGTLFPPWWPISLAKVRWYPKMGLYLPASASRLGEATCLLFWVCLWKARGIYSPLELWPTGRWLPPCDMKSTWISCCFLVW